MNFLNTIAVGAVAGSDASLQLNNKEVLYSKVQRVYIKPQHKEERQKDIRVNVEIHAGLSPVCRKSLCVLLADDEDPCFLYSLFITDDDFKILKSQQGLLVDFDNFATQLIHLLEQCQVPSGNLCKSSKFLMFLAEEGGEWCLKLVETNNFKHLCHLSLNIAAANDFDIKTHMAMEIKGLKESIVNKDKDISSLKSSLAELTNKLESKRREMEQFEQKVIAEKTQLQTNLSHQIAMEKDRLTQAHLEWQSQSDRNKMEIEMRHGEALKNLHAELAELRTKNNAYKDRQSLLEATNGEQVKLIHKLEKDLNIAQRDYASIKEQNMRLDTECKEKEKTLNGLFTRVAVLEQELKDKTTLINKYSEMLKGVKEQKQSFEELLGERDAQLQKKQSSLKGLSEELVKANEILSKLQHELASTKSKLNLRTSIALEQERLLDNKQKEIGQLDNKLESLNKECQEVKNELENVKSQVKELQSQLEEKQKVIKNNDNVINWLNKRLADNHGPFHSAPSQLTLPQSNKFTTWAVGQNSTQATTLSNQPLRNPTVRTTTRSTAAGINENSLPFNFNKPGPISHTSTPLETANSLNKLYSMPSTHQSAPAMVDNNNAQVPALKSIGNSLQGGLRRVAIDKPLLPSAYFPKTLSNQ